MSIRAVGVIGAGQMGSGIAQVAAMSGFDVVLQDVSSEALARGQKRIEQSLSKLLEKGKLTRADVDAANARVKGSQKLEDLARVDLVVEAVVENASLKFELFRKL